MAGPTVGPTPPSHVGAAPREAGDDDPAERRRRYTVGVGVRPRATAGELVALAGAVLAEHAIPPDAVVVLATLDRRAGHPAVLALAAAHGWPVIGCTAAQLAAVAAPSRSDRVRAAVGTPSVAEAAALLAAVRVAAASLSDVLPVSDLVVTKRTVPTAAIAIAIA